MSGSRRILITGINSYVGNVTEQYLMEYNARQGRELYRVDKLSLRGEDWENVSFAGYDAVLQVAGIAHADIGRVSEEEKALYYRVNCDLAVKAAKKAREEGVGQFIYLSSIIVYGDSAGVGNQRRITAETVPAPSNFYGDSKWQAEKQLRTLETSRFLVAVLRPPMIYGRGSRGNFPLLVKLAERLPVFPSVHNDRSVLYAENLAEFIRRLIETKRGGCFFPQNAEYATTAQLVKEIAAAKGKKIRLCGLLNPLVRFAAKMPGKTGRMANKAFGSLVIDRELEDEELFGYQLYNLTESVERSV